MPYVLKQSESEGITPQHFIALWVKDNNAVSWKVAMQVGLYFVDKHNKRRPRKSDKKQCYRRFYPLKKPVKTERAPDIRNNPPDGWRQVANCQCYIENKHIIKAISPVTGETLYPYRLINGKWVKDQTMILNTFRKYHFDGTAMFRPD